MGETRRLAKRKLTKAELLKLRREHKKRWGKWVEQQLKAIRESENIRAEDLRIIVR